MYAVLAILFVIVFWAGALLGQQGTRPVDDQQEAHVNRVLKLRMEMHRRMMEKLLNGTGPDQDMFGDMEEMMNDLMKDSFGNSGAMGAGPSSNFKMEWVENATGRILAITPNNSKDQLDINVADSLITIKGKREQRTANGVSYANFSNSLTVPPDCDASKVKIDQKEGRILVQFSYLRAKTKLPRKEERKPLQPSSSDVPI
jgi:HSP20 family molecular chaperone IbpA